MAEWNTVGGDWFPIGRMGSRGDQLGLRIQAAKVGRHLMQIAFMVSRRYSPYKKWFGTLFTELPVADRLEPVLVELLRQERWQMVEEKIADAISILLQEQNRLAIAPKVALDATKADDGRHHIALDFRGIVRGISQDLSPQLKSLLDNQVFWLHERNLILWNEEVGKWSLLLQREGK